MLAKLQGPPPTNHPDRKRGPNQRCTGLGPKIGYFGLPKNKKAVLALTSGAFEPAVAEAIFLAGRA